MFQTKMSVIALTAVRAIASTTSARSHVTVRPDMSMMPQRLVSVGSVTLKKYSKNSFNKYIS